MRTLLLGAFRWALRAVATVVVLVLIVLGILALLTSCGGADRQLCYAAAEARAASEAQQRCPVSVPWDTCPERQRILDELRQDYRRCP